MEIYLIRHTTPDIEKGICYGQADLSVTATFEIELSNILTQLKGIHPTVIYSSPLQRCTTLANALKKEFNTPEIQTDARLKEVDFGDWELKPWDTIPQPEIDPWMKDFVHTAPPNGESFIQLQKRVQHFFEEVPVLLLDKTIIIVSHAGPMRAFLASISNTELKDAFSISLTYGQIEKVLYKDGTFVWQKS